MSGSGLIVKPKVNGKGYDMIIGAPEAFLRQEFGIILEQNKNKSIADAIVSPGDFIKKRDATQNKAAEKAGEEFERYMGNLLDVGVPTETAKQMALVYAQTIYNAEMGVYEMANPGYATAIGKHVVEREEKEGVRDLYLEGKEQRRAYKKKVQKKYKAKQAAKAAAKAAQEAI